MKAAIEAAPSEAGLDLANWNWRVVQCFVHEHFDRLLSSRSCLHYLHRLGFVVKRPKKRLLKAKAVKVREKVDAFFAGLAERTEEVRQRCRRDLQAWADALAAKAGEVAA